MKHLAFLISGIALLGGCSAPADDAMTTTQGGAAGLGGAAGSPAGVAGQPAAGGVGAGGAASAGAAGMTGGGGSSSGLAGAAGAAGGGAGGMGGGGAGGAPVAGGAGGQGGAAGGAAGGGGGGAGGAMQMTPEQALYTTNCSACHGPTGEGGVLGPEIRHPVPEFTIWMVRNGSMPRNPNTTYLGPMVPLDEGFITDAELAMVMDYLNSFPKPTTGPELYADFCANCHGADGKGGPTTRDLTMLAEPLATAVPTNVRGGHHPGEYNLLNEYMPAQDMTVLSDQELMLIATHIETL